MLHLLTFLVLYFGLWLTVAAIVSRFDRGLKATIVFGLLWGTIFPFLCLDLTLKWLKDYYGATPAAKLEWKIETELYINEMYVPLIADLVVPWFTADPPESEDADGTS